MLTFNVYTQFGPDDERRAVEALPDLAQPGANSVALSATGTNALDPKCNSSVWASCWASEDTVGCSRVPVPDQGDPIDDSERPDSGSGGGT